MDTFSSKSQCDDIIAIQWTGVSPSVCDDLEHITRGRIQFDKDGDATLPVSTQTEKVRPLNIGDWVYKYKRDKHYSVKSNDAFMKEMDIWGFEKVVPSPAVELFKAAIKPYQQRLLDALESDATRVTIRFKRD